MAGFRHLAAAASEAQSPNVPAIADNLLVRTNGHVRLLAEVIRETSADERLKTYRELRRQYSDTAAGQVDLAKWCRKQGLADEEQLHWKILLSMEPDHTEAIKALRLRRHRGALLTREEYAKAKQQEKQTEQAADRWLPELRKLRQAIDHGDADERAAAIRKLREIQDPLAIPALEKIFPIEDAAMSLQFVEVVANIPGEPATDVLARLAIDSPDEYAREQASAALGSRSDHTYVPRLVGRLAAPIELQSFISVDPGGQNYVPYATIANTGRLIPFFNKIRLRSEYTINDVACWSPECKPFSGFEHTGERPDQVHYEYVLTRESPDPDYPYTYTGSIDATSPTGSGAQGSEALQKSIAELKRQISEHNAATAKTNWRIHAALKKATGVHIKLPPAAANSRQPFVDPRLWWNWWRVKLNMNNYFAAGTEVWTQIGLMPIEQIMIGDRVLTRDAASGESAFRLVMGIGRQGKSEVRILKVDSRTIVATPEQPFFVHGDGWRPAKSLATGMQLETLAEAKVLDSIETETEDATYSLLVDGEPNYFVDRQGILAHDASRPVVRP